MSITTSQQITRLYEQYRGSEITFTKEIVNTLNLDPRQIYLKCPGSQWSCIINSASLNAAKIIIGTKGGAYAAVSAENTAISLRFCFINPVDHQPLSFFVNARVGEIAPYGDSKDLAIVTLNYTQRPPDDLIEIMGKLLETATNAVRCKDQPIILTEESRRRMGIAREDTIVFIQNVPRHCILREISFSGAKIVLLGLAPFLKDKEVSLRIEFEEPKEAINLKGIISSTQEIEGRKDILSAVIHYDEKFIPMQYKMHVNSYISAAPVKRAVQQTGNP